MSEDESFCQDINECEIYENDDDDEEDENDERNKNGNHPRATFCSHTCTNLIGQLYSFHVITYKINAVSMLLCLLKNSRKFYMLLSGKFSYS